MMWYMPVIRDNIYLTFNWPQTTKYSSNKQTNDENKYKIIIGRARSILFCIEGNDD